VAYNCARIIDLSRFIICFCSSNREVTFFRSNLICKALAYDKGYAGTAVKSKYYLLHKKLLPLGHGDIAPRNNKGRMAETEQKPYRKIKPNPIHPYGEAATVVCPKPHPRALKAESIPIRWSVSPIVACQPRPTAQACDQNREGDPAEDE